MSRLEGNNINNPTNDQEDMMLEIMSLLNDTVTPVPDVGNFYTFVYNPKTPNITYDQHPLIACTDIFGWGFRGLIFTGESIVTIHGQNSQGSYTLYNQMNLMIFLQFLMLSSV